MTPDAPQAVTEREGSVHRTTVSLPADLHAKFAANANALGITLPEAFRQAASWFLNLNDARSEQDRAQALARKFVEDVRTLGQANPYLELVADWRLERTGGQIDQLFNFRLELEAWPAHTYLTKLLSSLMGRLDQKDEFLTVTNLRFWKDALVDTFYLDEQERAIGNGMSLHRIFLIRPEEQNVDPKLLEPHLAFLRNVSNRWPGRVKVGFVHPENCPQDWYKMDHFALIRRKSDPKGEALPTDPDGACMLVEPAYDLNGGITRLRFHFSNLEKPTSQDLDIRHYRSSFHKLAKLSRPLEAWRELVPNSPSQPKS